jgi:hypothetical protein
LPNNGNQHKKTPPEKYKQLKVNKKDHLDGQNNMTYEEQPSGNLQTKSEITRLSKIIQDIHLKFKKLPRTHKR